MLEINPVLAGKFDNLPYLTASATSPTTSSATSPTSVGQQTAASADTTVTADPTSKPTPIDPRRYTQWDRTSTEVHTDNNMTFGDFLDMINPLQHIPVVSSVYRAITGDKINPISRVAGDILYGGAIGVASALMGGVGAIGDTIMESQTGKDGTGYMMASLFGSDAKTNPDAGSTPSETMVADASSNPAVAAQIAAQISAQNSATQNATAATPAKSASATITADASSSSFLRSSAKAFPLNRTNKLPFGGAMAPVGATQPTTAPLPVYTGPTPVAGASGTMDLQTAIALNEGSHSTRIGNTIYTNRFPNNVHAPRAAAVAALTDNPTAGGATMPVNSANTTIPTATGTALSPTPKNQTAANPVPAATDLAAQLAAESASTQTSAQAATQTGTTQTMSFAGGQKNPLPQSLIDDVVMLQALKKYNNTASTAGVGGNVNVTN
jgi:hypothetical protein